MRRFVFIFSFIFILLSTFQLNAQNTGTYHKKWLFGMNWGGAWENADVHSRLGNGWGLTLEKEIIANNTSVFGFSLRGRYLHTWMWGRESSPFYGVSNDNNLNGITNPSINYTSSGYVYRNFYTKTDEFSLEGLLILNRLRAHSGFKIYGFGGIGATGYISKINQLDATGNTYDYSSVSTFSKGVTKNDLNNLWDKSYETNGVAGQNKSSYVLSGAIGLGVGIKLSPNVYLGWEHKYTYTSTDNLDASNWKIDGTKSLKNDRYHYSSLFLTVAIGSGSASGRAERTPEQKTYYPTPASDPKPAITLLFPHENPVYLQQCTADIKVSITNVASVNQITVLRDGNVLSANNYSFDAVTEVLAIHTPISGNTVFSIIAQNSSGKDTKYVYTNCDPVLTAPEPVGPVVSIVSSSSVNCIASVVASVKNVTDAKSIEVIMDGIILSSQQYNFNPYNGSVVVKAPFNQFTAITIRATSNGNSAVQTVNLSCTPIAPAGVPNTAVIPIINIISSNVDIDNNSNCTARITASVSGVSSVSMISVTRNGVLVNPQNYSFDPATGIVTIDNVILGENTFLIKAANSIGSTTASATVDCAGRLPKPPVIERVQPATPSYASVTCREHIAIKVLDVKDIQSIVVSINGVAIAKNLMRFDTQYSLLTFDALITKETVIVVSATNTDGTAIEKLIINCAPILAPTILISSPTIDPFVSASCQETVVATVTGVEDLNSIHITLNGIVSTTGVNYDAATGKLMFPVNVAGRSEVLISAVGKGGSASKSVTIICQPAPKPVITLIAPATSTYVSSTCQEQVSVQIQNIKAVSDVSVTVNSSALASNALNYNAGTGVLVFPVQFTGTASVVVKASNVNGVTLQTLSLQCKPILLPKPTIVLIAPVAINTLSKTCREAVKLKLTNCASLTDISVLQNDLPVKSEFLTYKAATGILAFEASVVGTTTFIVSAKNNGGIATTTFNIECKPAILPSVSMLEPIGTPVISTECLENFKAVVKNVAGLDQIEVIYNGASINRSLLFYDSLTSILTFSHAFRADGDLVIKASNEAGQSTKTISLVCKTVEEKITICHIPPGNTGNVQTLTISKSALSAHLAHGDHVGACTDSDERVKEPEVKTPPVEVPPVVVPPVEDKKPVEEKITICHIPPGNTENVQTLTISKSALSAHLAHGDHVGACTDSDERVKEPEVKTPPVEVPPVVVPPVEEKKPIEEKITICHIPPGNTGNVQTLTISKSALSAHLAHGDHVGACTDSDERVKEPEVKTPPVEVPPVVVPPVEDKKPVEEKITICHKPADNSTTVETMIIPKSELSEHLAHGDHVGRCSDADLPAKKPDIKIPVEVPPVEEKKPIEEKITICHKPADNSTTVETMIIPKSELSEHLAHGDHIGRCSDADLPAKKPDVKTPDVEVPPVVALPATTPTPTPDPPKQEDMVTICHTNPDGTKQTLTVPQSQVQKHMQHGDHVGVCTPDEMH